MTDFKPEDPNFAQRVRDSFNRQRAMSLIGAQLTRVEAGIIEILLPYRDDLTQQHGFVHAGIVTAIADTACGYAAYTLMPATAEVLSVEFKVNLLRPASGESLTARAEVVKPGRTITVVRADVTGRKEDQQTLIATMLATMIRR